MGFSSMLETGSRTNTSALSFCLADACARVDTPDIIARATTSPATHRHARTVARVISSANTTTSASAPRVSDHAADSFFPSSPISRHQITARTLRGSRGNTKLFSYQRVRSSSVSFLSSSSSSSSSDLVLIHARARPIVSRGNQEVYALRREKKRERERERERESDRYPVPPFPPDLHRLGDRDSTIDGPIYGDIIGRSISPPSLSPLSSRLRGAILESPECHIRP